MRTMSEKILAATGFKDAPHKEGGPLKWLMSTLHQDSRREWGWPILPVQNTGKSATSGGGTLFMTSCKDETARRLGATPILGHRGKTRSDRYPGAKLSLR